MEHEEVVEYTPDAGRTALRQPHALVAFGGWVDAGSGGTGAVRHLVSSLEARKIAEIDPEPFYSFTDTRPLTSVVGPGERAVHWPRGEFHAAPMRHTSDLLLFSAPEPNLKWRTFARALLDVMQRFDVGGIFSIGSIFGAVHHRGEVRLTGWATEPVLRDALLRRNVTFTSYEGPTGFVTVLLDEAKARGIPAAAIFGFAPSYIQGVPNPRVSHALLRSFAEVTGAPLDLAELDRSGRALMRQVDRLLLEQPQLREQVDRMLSLMNISEPGALEEEPSLDRPPPPVDEGPVELPSGQAVVRELEEFLKQLRQRDGGNDVTEP